MQTSPAQQPTAPSTAVGLQRLTGACSLIGGAAWVAACFVHNTLPQGCIDEGCADRQMRGETPTAAALFAVAGLSLAAAGLGLLVLARRRREPGRLGLAAAVTGALGIGLLAAAGVVSGFVDSDFAGMPALVVPGILGLAAAIVLVALVVLRARVLPPWSAALLLVTALALPFANEQTSLILLAVPFGVAWFLAGALLVRRP